MQAPVRTAARGCAMCWTAFRMALLDRKVLAADANKARAAIAGRRDPAGIAEPYASAP
jgi:hypothetical protein